MDLPTALDICDRGFETWATNPTNKRWFRKIDGTPIPNDLKVAIAQAMVRREWPEGRIGPDDDGATEVAITHDQLHSRVIVRFQQPTSWIGLDRESCSQLIATLIKHMEQLEPTP
ncbi:MAG: hypothetical protein KDB18_10190 [Salinibacterium sp.]|nr:hypothetical protein [Salinibacterium sp.]